MARLAPGGWHGGVETGAYVLDEKGETGADR